MEKVHFIVPVQEIARGKPKFGVWVVTDKRMAYVRIKEGTWGDAFKRGMALAAGNISIYASIRAWEEYREMLEKHLRSLDLPEDFIENLDKYVMEKNGFMARIEEISVKRGKGFLGGESADGLTPIELKAPHGFIKFRIEKELFEKQIKPILESLPIKSYKEAKFWAV
ncbi:hypothetical protein [Thermococcus sp.]